MEKYVLTDDGDAVLEPDLIRWAKWYEGARQKWHVVTRHGRLRVSTIFLGLDHSFVDGGRPILWETMVFRDPRLGELASRRYYTRAEALAGHKRFARTAALGRWIGWRLACWLLRPPRWDDE